MKYFLSLTIILVSMISFGQSCIGKWVTIDDESFKKKSVVKLYKKDGVMYGRIEKLFLQPGEEENPKCDQCKGSLKDKPIIGLLIIRGMKWNGSEWTGGTIVDPENGVKYKAKIWIDPDNKNRLKVRGYYGIFYRTQTWILRS